MNTDNLTISGAGAFNPADQSAGIEYVEKTAATRLQATGELINANTRMLMGCAFEAGAKHSRAVLAMQPAPADHTALLSELYQILGAHDASEKALEQVQAAIAGEPLPHASLLPYEVPDAYEPQDCEACNGHGMVGGLRPDGYDGEICPACGGTCEQPYSATSDRYRAELERRLAAEREQPNAVKVPREQLDALRRAIADYVAVSRRSMVATLFKNKEERGAERRVWLAARALLGKEGE